MVVMVTDHLLGHVNVGIFNTLLVPCHWRLEKIALAKTKKEVGNI
jgi:hypothetical protein